MKKSNFVALVMGTVSMLFFALGMCMALLPQWNSFTTGIVFGVIGIVLGLITVMIWRKMEKKVPLKLSGKNVKAILISVVGALLLSVGMCLCLVWENFIVGTLVGILGIAVLLFLIPAIKGLK